MNESDLDAAIDDVAREMTAGDLDPAFRTRVLDRLEPGLRGRDSGFGIWGFGPSGRWRSVLAGVTVAAIIVTAVVVFRGRHESATTVTSMEQLPAAPVAAVEAGTSTSRPAFAGPPVAQHPGEVKPDATSRGVTVKRDGFTGTSEVDALAPPPLDVPSIALAGLPAPESIQLNQLQTISPIAVAPLAADDQGERR